MTARAGRFCAIGAVLALGGLALAAPGAVLRGGLAWLVVLLAAASGGGYLIVRIARRPDPDLGLRAALGLAGYLAAAGVLVALGLCTRPVVLALLGIGLAGFAWHELVTDAPLAARLGAGWRYARAHPALGVLAAVLVAGAVLNLVGAVAHLDRNPWDDDLAYTPLIKRLLDAGNLLEPFSFRRLGAYGGQTALQALVGARGSLANLHLLDRGLCQAIALLIAAGHARDRGTRPVYVALLALVLIVLPDTSINTAAEWSGVALFYALYRVAQRGEWTFVGLVGAAACTLRQNYLAVVVLFVVWLLLAARRTGGWREVRARARPIAIVAVLAIAGWLIAAQRSSGTFLFPLVGGTFNDALTLKPAVMTWADELSYVAWAAIETSPLVVVPILFIVACVIRDRRPAAPLRALFAATCLGFLLLVHGFAGTDPVHLWRYTFGFSIALFAALVVEAGGEDGDDGVSLVPLGRWLLLAALALQLLAGRGAIAKRYADLGADLREAASIDRHGDPASAAEAKRYAALQAAVPAGAPLLVMLDDPYLLDFARNPIANLDTPGFASPAPHLPAFQGPEALRTYLSGLGYRYVAFVRTDRSRYFFRRPFWVWRLFNDGELFAAMSAYTIDAIDSFAALATTSTVLHDADGLVALDLGPTAAPVAPSAVPEDQRRDDFVRSLADRDGLHDAWSLTNRRELRFEDGVANLVFVDGGIDDPAWFEIAHARVSDQPRGKATRSINRRAHLRVRGTGPHVLVIEAQIALNAVYTHPRLDVVLDGELLATAIADARGHYSIRAEVAADRLAGGWHDVYLISSSAIEPDHPERDLRVARLESVDWRPAP